MQTFLRDGRWLTAEEVEAYNTSNQSVIEPDKTEELEIIEIPEVSNKSKKKKIN